MPRSTRATLEKQHAQIITSREPIALEASHLPIAFRQFAADFRAIPELKRRAAGQPDQVWSVNDREFQLQDKAGCLVIQAYEKRALPSLGELDKLVRFHQSKAPPLPGKGRAQYARCPANLFNDLAGGGLIEAEHDGHGNWKFGEQFGGVLPRMGLLPESGLDSGERFARAAEVLADMIESTRTLPLEDATWYTVTKGATLLSEDIPSLSLSNAKARVSAAAGRGEFVTNGKERNLRRIEPVSFDAWRLKQRDRDLDAEDEGPEEIA